MKTEIENILKTNHHTCSCCFNFGVEMFCEDEFDYNLSEKYKHFNDAYFDGQLPIIPIKFAKLKNLNGVAKCKFERIGPPPNPRMVRLGYQDKYANCVVKPESVHIIISSLFKRSESALDATLLHEMIHIYFYTVGNRIGESHGRNFMAMLRKLQKESGIDIPATDTSADVEVNKTSTRTVGVILLKKSNYYIISLHSEKVLMSKLDIAIVRVKSMVKAGFALDGSIWLVNAPICDKASYLLPLQRTFDRALKFYGIEKFPGILEEIENGRNLF